jgi:hypothetical protein
MCIACNHLFINEAEYVCAYTCICKKSQLTFIKLYSNILYCNSVNSTSTGLTTYVSGMILGVLFVLTHLYLTSIREIRGMTYTEEFLNAYYH